jgi:hypothetical protein
MSSASPSELSAPIVIERIESGLFPREVVLNVARGFLPLGQEDLIAVLSYLTTKDAEVADMARASLAEVPARSISAFAANERAAPEHLALLMRASEDPAVLELLIRNRALPDAPLVELAGRADPEVQEIIVINQARILQAPEILDALLANPRLSAETRRRALENREEFFEKKARRLEELAEDEIAEDLPIDAIADLLEKAEQEDAIQPNPPQTLPVDMMDQTVPAFTRILHMSVADKVKLAFKGGRSERNLLVRDRNKLICSAVMRNPRMSETEAEQIASLRNVDEEVLRIISTRRDWMSKLTIMSSLARNPRTPIGVVLPLINRLTLRELKALKDDKGVSEVVRATARKLFGQRSKNS